MEIRIATVEDAEAIREIYAPYVINTAVSFECELPSIEEFHDRISNTTKEYPYYVAILDNEIVGYAYASAFHTRKAYRHSAELSVYIRQDCRRLGIGRVLYQAIENVLVRQNVYVVHACVACTEYYDEFLTDDSIKFHEKMGFEIIGKHYQCAYKFGRWYSIIWMDKVIQERDVNPDAFIPFSKLGEYLRV